MILVFDHAKETLSILPFFTIDILEHASLLSRFQAGDLFSVSDLHAVGIKHLSDFRNQGEELQSPSDIGLVPTNLLCNTLKRRSG